MRAISLNVRFVFGPGAAKSPFCLFMVCQQRDMGPRRLGQGSLYFDRVSFPCLVDLYCLCIFGCPSFALLTSNRCTVYTSGHLIFVWVEVAVFKWIKQLVQREVRRNRFFPGAILCHTFWTCTVSLLEQALAAAGFRLITLVLVLGVAVVSLVELAADEYVLETLIAS